VAVRGAEGVFAAAFGDVAGEERDVFCTGERWCELRSKSNERVSWFGRVKGLLTTHSEVGGLGGDDGGGKSDGAVAG
jgi:hypothetical protein